MVFNLRPKEEDSQSIAQAKLVKRKRPSEKLTALHAFYIFCWNGGGALIIAGGANFGIATGTKAHIRVAVLDHFAELLVKLLRTC